MCPLSQTVSRVFCGVFSAAKREGCLCGDALFEYGRGEIISGTNSYIVPGVSPPYLTLPQVPRPGVFAVDIFECAFRAWRTKARHGLRESLRPFTCVFHPPRNAAKPSKKLLKSHNVCIANEMLWCAPILIHDRM